MTNIKLYEDGDRLIIAIENPESSVKDLIKGMFGAIVKDAEKITNVAPPPKAAEENAPILPGVNMNDKKKPSNIVEETNRLIQEQSYKGFLTAYINYNAECKNMEDAEKKKVKEIIFNYLTFMRSRNVSEITDDELKDIIRLGAEKVYKKTITNCMRQCNVISLGDFLESGRKNLEYAYKSCFKTT